MARTATGIDVGLRTAVALRGSYKGNTFHATNFGVTSYAVSDPVEGWDQLELDFKPGTSRVGITGRDVNIRYTRVPRVPDWQLRNLMRFEVEEIGDQSGALASDFNLLPELPEIEGEDMVVLAMARESLLAGHHEGLEAHGGKLEAFTPNAIALYNAFLRYGVIEEQTVLLANIGHDNVDVIICRGPDLVFARNLQGGSRLLSDAIAQRFSISESKAEEIKVERATLRPGARFSDATEEKASRAMMGAAGQVLSLLQSTVLFCKSQVKLSTLKVDKVLLCGGGAGLDGICEYLAGGMNVPVELFEPFTVVDTSGLSPEESDLLEEHKLEAVCALGLATMASDPESYSLEILPEKVRKAREFWGGKALVYAAGLLAIGYLGFNAYKTRTDLQAYTQQARVLQGTLKRVETTDRKVRDLLVRNEELAEYAGRLQGIAGCGEQLARAIDRMEGNLPAEFWITRMETGWESDEDLGIPRNFEKPILRLRGSSQQGTGSLSTSFENLAARIAELPGIRTNPQLSPSGTEFSMDLTFFGPPLPEDTVPEEPEEEGEDA